MIILQIFADAIYKATWDQKVQNAIKADLKKPAPDRIPRTIAIIKTTERDMDYGILRNLEWEIQRGTDGKIYINLYHAKISECKQ